MSEFPISEKDLDSKQLVFDLPDNQQLILCPLEYQKQTNGNKECAIRNLSAIYYIASKQFIKYHQIVNLYRQDLNQFADEATDEPTSHMLGAGEDFAYILKDTFNLKRDLQEKYQWVLNHATEENIQKFQQIWDEKLAWCDHIIEIITHASWLETHFDYGTYQNVEGICQLYLAFTLN